MDAIPTIDFSAFLPNEGCLIGESPTAGQQLVAAQIDRAMCEHGFIYMENLGITAEEVRAAFDVARALFENPEHEKCAELARWTAKTNLGYKPMRTEAINPKRAPDLHDAFILKSFRYYNNDLRGTPAAFEQLVRAFWDKAEAAARRFNFACALALGLPVADMDFFAKSTSLFDMCTLKYNHYPPCDFVAGSTDGSVGLEAIRAGEHTDFGAFTFLFLDGEAPGLQVRRAMEGDALNVVPRVEDFDKTWLDAPGRGGATAIVNSGALLAQWTNDRWRASAHRVIVPSAAEAAGHRYSLPFFVVPDSGTVIEAHPSLVAEGEEPNYAPTTTDEYYKMRVSAIAAKTPPQSIIGGA
jgi:isopenicillin N synthase-like dioxygenase